MENWEGNESKEKRKLKKLKKPLIESMKRSIIILLVLIAFFAIPALAGTPQPENAPATTSEDTMFLGLEQLTLEQLLNIIGNAHPDMDGNNPGFEDMIACGMPSSEYDIDTLSEFIEFLQNAYNTWKEITDPDTYINWLIDKFQEWLEKQGK